MAKFINYYELWDLNPNLRREQIIDELDNLYEKYLNKDNSKENNEMLDSISQAIEIFDSNQKFTAYKVELADYFKTNDPETQRRDEFYARYQKAQKYSKESDWVMARTALEEALKFGNPEEENPDYLHFAVMVYLNGKRDTNRAFELANKEILYGDTLSKGYYDKFLALYYADNYAQFDHSPADMLSVLGQGLNRSKSLYEEADFYDALAQVYYHRIGSGKGEDKNAEDNANKALDKYSKLNQEDIKKNSWSQGIIEDICNYRKEVLTKQIADYRQRVRNSYEKIVGHEKAVERDKQEAAKEAERRRLEAEEEAKRKREAAELAEKQKRIEDAEIAERGAKNLVVTVSRVVSIIATVVTGILIIYTISQLTKQNPAWGGWGYISVAWVAISVAFWFNHVSLDNKTSEAARNWLIGTGIIALLIAIFAHYIGMAIAVVSIIVIVITVIIIVLLES